MDVKYCLPMVESESKVVAQTIADNLTRYQYFEVWLDYLDQVETDFVVKLAAEYGERLIFLFRRKELEAIQLSFEQRSAIIAALASQQSYLDLDLDTQSAELELIKKSFSQLPLITSFHNYRETPSDDILRQKLEQMLDYNPQIRKIATQCNSEQDAVRLLALLLNLQGRTIVLGMGTHGLATRVFGTIWGNEMIFAPLSTDTATASGQLTRDELEIIFKKLK